MEDIFYSIGIILTFIIGVWNIVNNYRASRRTAFINTVTAERVKWIEKLREHLTVLRAHLHVVISRLEDTERRKEIVEEIDKLRHLIRLQFVGGRHS